MFKCCNLTNLFHLYSDIFKKNSKMSKEYDRRATIISGLCAGHTAKEISKFNNIPLRTVYNVKKAYDSNPDNATPIRKRHDVRNDRTSSENVNRIQEFVNEDPGRSMRSIARELEMSNATVRKIVHEDLRYRSYVMRKGHFMTQQTKERRLDKAKKLLSKFKNSKEKSPLIFFSDEKNFQQDQVVNKQNNRWLCKNINEVPIIMKTKFPAAIMVMGVVSNEGDIMAPHFFSKGLRLNSDTYLEVLKDIVVPWMKQVANERYFIFQQDGAPAHNAKKVQEFLSTNIPDFWSKDIWPPSSPDANPLDYYVWSVCEREVNKQPHATISSLQVKIIEVFESMDKVNLIKACSRFRNRIESIIEVNGDFFEQIKRK